MERRKALKNMGAAFGYAVATPTLLGILKSCNTNPSLDWTPSFFSKEEGVAVHNLLDILLPKTDTPSATELNVHQFIDQYLQEILPDEQKAFTKTVMNAFFSGATAAAGKESLAEMNASDLEPTFVKFLGIRSDSVEKDHEASVEAYMGAAMKGETAELDAEVASYTFANQLRDMAIWGFKSSEYIGEEVLAYLPVPGEYVPCGDLDELTGGRDWSI